MVQANTPVAFIEHQRQQIQPRPGFNLRSAVSKAKRTVRTADGQWLPILAKSDPMEVTAALRRFAG
ncbi:hypothetical protein C4K05_2261 [Pseudomonas chlororaphis subsp. aureofaciens]|jgi:hypothetical protein|uniref:hypothetical protein n=1 Tax=Pseudomonas chlororaphis TaxID=587753 RepID=UPI000F55C3D6|nr:hypothetical protein [Pseudomonas chlororaphis]AZD98095.1 hypothetical protein C4K12_2229 [Pseudomonas chlororaphis subsp. aureofaciens]AZE35194.1 hypothetical protein C4K06_2161 [Pseudomonas chlororaphis subsp. aureofaciens]AZE41601.1 hypothetical protein C4K05_2261 [Pseudomonas chlororaphis subsp. aureofaciens]